MRIKSPHKLNTKKIEKFLEDKGKNREWLAATLQQTSEMGSDNETAAA